MKTDHLVDLLSSHVEPVRRGQVWQALTAALSFGAAAAFCVMAVTVGPQSGVADGAGLGFLAAKLVFAASLVGAGGLFLARAVQPGRDAHRIYTLIFLPFLALAAAAVVALASAPTAEWGGMILGTRWLTCLVCIPLFAVAPFMALVLAVRHGAPTDVTRTGAVAGVVAGALGAAAYAFYCPDDSLPFIAVWYSLAIALCGFAGAKIGPRFIRW